MNALKKPEIGGYLELESFSGQHFHAGAIKLHCCRSALLYALELRDVMDIWLPNFMCDVVANTCIGYGAQIHVYEISSDFLPDYESIAMHAGDYLYLADYYGLLNQEAVNYAATVSEGRLIIDETQGFFVQPWNVGDTLYTCRKFFGVADGGYISTYDGSTLGRVLKRGGSSRHMAHLLGRFEGSSADFYLDSVKNNERLDGYKTLAMSPITENLLNVIDYDEVQKIREDNYRTLNGILGPYNKLALECPSGPFMYPLLVDDSGDTRQELASSGVFVPTLWPNVLSQCEETSIAYCYAKNILPLPVDQRYRVKEMQYVASAVKNCFGW